MTPERMRVLNSAESDRLTADEMAAGWHFCPDWDFLLVNMNDKEGEGACCCCRPQLPAGSINGVPHVYEKDAGGAWQIVPAQCCEKAAGPSDVCAGCTDASAGYSAAMKPR